MKELDNIYNLNEKNMQELSKSNKKGELELPKKIKLRYGQGSISYLENKKIYQGRYMLNKKQVCIYGRTQTEIKKKLKQAILNRDKAEKQKSELTLSKWLLEWLETYKKPFLSNSSILSISTCINKYLIPTIGNFNIENLNSQIVQKTLNNIEFPRQKEISYNVLNASLNKALQLKLTDNNYMLAVIKQKAKIKRGKAFTTSEQKNFIKALNNFITYKNVFLSYLYTGCRRNELLSLRFCDIDFDNNKITIRGTKTDKAFRNIPMNEKLKDILINADKSNEFVFCFKPDMIDKTFVKICNSINLNGFTVHSLRHTFATRCLENNISAKVVQQWLGHSKINITLDTYSHIQNEFEKEQSNYFNDIF